jgi:ribonuclease P protein component
VRLSRREDFARVFADNLRASDEHLTVLARVNELEHPRLGIAVSRKVVGSAVERNRFKRVVREQFRLMQHDMPALDVVVLARPGIVGTTPAALGESLRRLMGKVSARCRH